MRCTLEKQGLGWVVKVYADDGFILHEKGFNVNHGMNYEAAQKYQEKIRSGQVKIAPRTDSPIVQPAIDDQEKVKKSKKKAAVDE